MPEDVTIDARPAGQLQSVATIDGWTLDDSNPCGHKLHRTIRQGGTGTDFPVSISLTAGDMDDEIDPTVEVSERALRWLLTGAT